MESRDNNFSQPSAGTPGPIPNAIIPFPVSCRWGGDEEEGRVLPHAGAYPPVIAVFSVAGGTGKTGLVANLGRALAMQGEEVLLLDTSLQENMAHYFGAGPRIAGEVQTAYDAKSDTRVRLAQLPIGCQGPGGDGEGWLRGEIAAIAADCDRIVIDLSVASRWLTQQILGMSPLLLIPMLPDWNAVLSLPRVEQFLDEADPDRSTAEPNFILNQFSPQIPFHRTVLQELSRRVGERLLSVLHKSLDVDEALAAGRTVLDFEPDAQVSRDYRALAGWIRSRSRAERGFGSAANEAS